MPDEPSGPAAGQPLLPAVGERWRSASRTVSESDIVGFAGLTGDYNSIHVDRVHAERSRHGERIAHGLLVAAFAAGLLSRTPRNQQLDHLIIALLTMQCEWLKPVRIGDTITAEQSVSAVREVSDGRRVIVDFERSVTNQDGDLVFRCNLAQMIANQ
jgi:3-hydroxybutyryl-CoA dehydratase